MQEKIEEIGIYSVLRIKKKKKIKMKKDLFLGERVCVIKDLKN